jgi:acyl-CoA thioesterase-1
MRWLLLVVLCWPSILLAESASPGKSVLVLGDSLSAAFGMAPEQGWVAALATRLSQHTEPWQVINISLSGETTAGGAARLERVLKAQRPEIVILELGGNDGLRGLSLKQTRANIEKMILQVQAHQARVLLLGMRLPPNYGEVYNQRFEAIFSDLATLMKLDFVPFFLQGVALNPDLMQSDGIHPRAIAQQQLLENIWPQLLPMLEPLTQ